MEEEHGPREAPATHTPAWDREASLGASNREPAFPAAPHPRTNAREHDRRAKVSSLAQLSSLRGDYSVMVPGPPQLLSVNLNAKSTSHPVSFKA